MSDASKRKRPLISENETKKQARVLNSPSQVCCSVCYLRLRITNTFGCRCSGQFCFKHRYSDEHNCPFDYKQENRLRLEKENPKILPSTITHSS
ncbi:AN1-type zinc finger protein 5/6 [Nematocida homosporus]|uniref:AN1-type zinc finger protein 5/6 n=1 Tax=Nematocida homosporus TaxID=1912981 RepID=UPI00221F6878|nr:AN1-type zinc finger protein 5/6 [Nematocida homosporus]KAI5184885.1 AN1-type zinc finger protein 5/6 [Nematocida homosporus]